MNDISNFIEEIEILVMEYLESGNDTIALAEYFQELSNIILTLGKPNPNMIN